MNATAQIAIPECDLSTPPSIQPSVTLIECKSHGRRQISPALLSDLKRDGAKKDHKAPGYLVLAAGLAWHESIKVRDALWRILAGRNL